MTRQELERAFEEKFHAYERFMAGGSPFSAILFLGEIENCLPLLEGPSRAKWVELVGRVSLSEDIVRQVRGELESTVETVRGILSYGSRWDYTELLLVLTHRIEIELVSEFLRRRDQLQPDEPAMDDIDEAMLQIATSKANKTHHQLAVSLARRNWGLPIVSQWLIGAG